MVKTRDAAKVIASKDNLIKITAWTRDGLSEYQIANNLGVHPNTFCRAKKHKEYGPAICNALAHGREVTDIEVENALYKRALGYKYDEIKEEYETGVLVKRTVTTKMVPPDTGAQIFWLKNRQPEKWRDRREVDNTVALDRLDEVLGQIKGVE